MKFNSRAYPLRTGEDADDAHLSIDGFAAEFGRPPVHIAPAGPQRHCPGDQSAARKAVAGADVDCYRGRVSHLI